jgi:hypothetical protein
MNTPQFWVGAITESKTEEKLLKICSKIDYFSIFVVFLIYVACATLIIFGSTKSWSGLIYDDCYYYLGIVRNIVENGTSSFLPPFQTNGYQPLWVLVLTTTAFIFGTSAVSLALQIFSLSFIFILAFAYIAKRDYGFAFPAVASALVFSSVTLWGMETTMMPVFILAFFSAKSWQSKGIFSSLIFLTRLDALAFIIVRDGYFFIFKKQRGFKHYLILAPAVILYFVINYALFGSPVPISGLAKSVGNVPGENLFLIYSYIPYLSSSILIIATLMLATAFGHNKALRFGDEIVILLGAYVAIYAYYATRSGWGIWGWYSWPAMMIFFFTLINVSLFLIESFKNLNKPNRGTLALPIAFIALAFIALGYALIPAAHFSWSVLKKSIETKNKETYVQKNLELIDFIKQENFSKGTFFAMGDRGGSFGFFLGNDYKFLHTEGLVGPYAYYNYMKKDMGAQFLRENKINYLIAERDRFFESGEVIGVAEPIQGLSSRIGPYLLCFNKSAIILDQTYIRNHVSSKRYMFDFSKEISCPSDTIKAFEDLRGKYGALRNYSLYSEYPGKRSFALSVLGKFIELPAGF